MWLSPKLFFSTLGEQRKEGVDNQDSRGKKLQPSAGYSIRLLKCESHSLQGLMFGLDAKVK
jgi:hypothetical protein